MRRKFFTFGSAVSLLLFVAVCVLWVRSLLGVDTFQRARFVPGTDGRSASSRVTYLTSGGGLVECRRDTGRYADPVQARALGAAVPTGWPSASYPRARAMWMLPDRTLGFGFERRVNIGGASASAIHDSTRLVMPWWFLACAAGLAPAIWARCTFRDRIARRRRLGQCAACGYDLRASPKRCPECGAHRVPTPGTAPHNPPL